MTAPEVVIGNILVATDFSAQSAQAIRAAAALAGESHCLVCALLSPERICEACAARIRGEALERLLDDEKAGRRGSSV